jgi:hypothetical protein
MYTGKTSKGKSVLKQKQEDEGVGDIDLTLNLGLLPTVVPAERGFASPRIADFITLILSR